jgi:hypothetical protein
MRDTRVAIPHSSFFEEWGIPIFYLYLFQLFFLSIFSI